MSIITFRCHTTIHLPLLVNRKEKDEDEDNEPMPKDVQREQQMSERINQGSRKNNGAQQANPVLEWYQWKEKNRQFPAKEHSIFTQAYVELCPVDNDNYRIEPIEEIEGAWGIYDKKLSSFFVFDPAITFLQKDVKTNRMFMVCADDTYGMIDIIEMNALLLDPIRQFMCVNELYFRPLDPDYYIWTGMMTGIDGLKIRHNARAGTWLLLQSESQVKKLRMLATIYNMDYPTLVPSDEVARRLAKEEAAGQCIRSKHGIVLITEDGLVYMDESNPDNDWELTYPVYNDDNYLSLLAFAYRKQVSGEVENYCMWKSWIDREWT